MATVVVAIDPRHARVGRFGSSGGPLLTDVPGEPGSDYLLRVVRAVGDAETINVVGSDPVRLAFEREYVAIVGHPERLRDHNAHA
jgi:hypothetical protein